MHLITGLTRLQKKEPAGYVVPGKKNNYSSVVVSYIEIAPHKNTLLKDK